MTLRSSASWLSLALLLWTAPAGAEPTQATRVVEELHTALLGVMKEADALGYQGRYDRLAPVLDRSFDIPFMAQKSVGRHWKELGEADRERLLATFRRFSIANYAGRFDGWSGQDFETLREEPSTHGTHMVRTRLVDPDGENVQLDYRLRASDGSWRIIDVHVDGTVSELALRRSENSSLIQNEGFDALIRSLEQKIGELATGKSS